MSQESNSKSLSALERPIKRSERLYQKRLLSCLEANLALEKLLDQIWSRDVEAPTSMGFNGDHLVMSDPQ